MDYAFWDFNLTLSVNIIICLLCDDNSILASNKERRIVFVKSRE